MQTHFEKELDDLKQKLLVMASHAENAVNRSIKSLVERDDELALKVRGEDNVIDQFDALTIGMSYNTSTPSVADLNNDSIINILDLELLAKNYRETGPVVWQ